MLAQNVNNGTDYSGWTVNLNVDIDLNQLEWTPIGTLDDPSAREIKAFKGTFDGQGHTVSNLKVSNVFVFAGLFGYLNGGSISNLTIDNANISNAFYAGGLVGDIEATYVAELTLTGSVIESEATVANVNVLNSTINGEVGSGGLVGGSVYSTIENCFVDSNVSVGSSSDVNFLGVGAIVGFSVGNTCQDNSYYSNAPDNTGATRLFSEKDFPVGINAQYTGDDDHKRTIGNTTYYTEGATFKLTLDNDAIEANYFSFAINGVTPNSDGSYDYIFGNDQIQIVACSKIVALNFDAETNSYLINSTDDWNALAEYISSGNDCNGLTFKLTTDIETEVALGTDATRFKGTFDGDNHKITAIITPFNYVDNATIKNLAVDNTAPARAGIVSSSSGNTTFDNCAFVGSLKDGATGFVNYNADKLNIINSLLAPKSQDVCYFASGNFSLSNCYSTVGLSDTTRLYSNATDVSAGYKAVAVTVGGQTCYQYVFDPATLFSGGDGSADNPYLIDSKDKLKALADYISDGGSTSGLNFKLTADIADVDFTIGTEANPFAGNFIGSGKTLTLAINDTNNQGTALFRYINGATIDNLTVSGSVTGGTHAAALVGFADGSNSISNITVNATVTGNSYTGGVVGHAKSSELTLTNVTFNGKLINSSKYAGGLVGWSDDGATLNLENCLFDGEYTGTVKFYPIAVKDENSVVTVNDNGAYYTAELTFNDENYIAADGTKLYPQLTLPDGVTATCAAFDKITLGGKDYYKQGAQITLTISEDLKNQFVGFDLKINNAAKIANADGSYSFTLGNDFNVSFTGYENIESLGFDTTDNSYTIANADQLLALAAYVIAGNNCNGLTFKLTEDIDLSGVTCTPISNFAGTFDGNDHIISNCDNFLSGGSLKNVTLLNETGGAFIDGNSLTTLYKISLPEKLKVVDASNGHFVTTATGDIYCSGGTTLKFKISSELAETYGNLGLKFGDTALTATEGVYAVTVSKSATINITGADFIDGLDFDTIAKTYLIKSPEDLQILAAYVNDGHTCEGTSFKLAENINLANVDYTPIGNAANPFAGNFDGDNHIISNLTLNGGDYQGLFGKVTGGTIENVKLADVNISGDNYVGGLIGSCDNATVTDNFVVGSISGTNNFGAIVGNNNNGNYSGNAYYSDTADNTGATKLYKITLPQNVEVTDADNRQIIKSASGDIYCLSGATVELKISDALTAIYDDLGLKIGDIALTATDGVYSFTVNKSATVDISGDNFISGLDLDVDTQTYSIKSADDLLILANFVNDGHDCAGLNFKLTDDIDLATFSSQLSEFAGTLDGDNYIISNCDNQELFGGGTVKNVTLLNASGGTIIGDGTSTKIFVLNLPEGITATCAASDKITVGDADYYKQGATLTFNLADSDNYSAIRELKINGNTVTATNGVYSATLDDDFSSIEFSGYPKIGNLNFDTAINSYLINNADDWNTLADYISGNRYYCAGLTFTLTADIETGNKYLSKFKGTFDGGNHKITASTSPFNSIENATIKNLVFDNSSSCTFISYNNGSSLIDNCKYIGELYGRESFVYCNFGSLDFNNCVNAPSTGTNVTFTNRNAKFFDCYTSQDTDENAIKISTTEPTVPENYTLKTLTIGGQTYYYSAFDLANIFGGDGSADNPYLIDSKGKLQALANYINDGGSTTDLNFKLTADIEGVDFTIGTEANPFAGNFIGSGKTLTLAINDTNNQGTALFRYINGATIDNLTVSGSVTGSTHAAALVGFADASNSISNITVNATVNSNSYTGGVVGHAKSSELTLTNVTFGGELNNKANFAGGLVGWSDGGATLNLNNCVFDGEYTGTVNFYPIAIKNENSAVTVNDNGAYYTAAPNFNDIRYISTAGTFIYENITAPDGLDVQLKDGKKVTVNGKEYYASGSTYTITLGEDTSLQDDEFISAGNNRADYVNITTYTLTVGNSANIEITNNLVAKFGDMEIDSVDGSYLITTADDLRYLADYVNAGNNCAGLKFKLANDIDLQSEDWTPIGNDINKPFSGSFDGQGYTVSNVKMEIYSNDSTAGFFSRLDGASVKNLNLSDVDITAVNCYYRAGGFAFSIINSTVENCSVSGKVNNTNSDAAAAFVVQLRNSTLINTFSNVEVTGQLLQNYGCSGNYYVGTKYGGSGGIRVIELKLPTGVTVSDVAENDKYYGPDGKTYIKSGAIVTLNTSNSGFAKINKIKAGSSVIESPESTFQFKLTDSGQFEIHGYRTDLGLTYDTAQDCYLISSREDFKTLANLTNNRGYTFEGCNFKLTTDINYLYSETIGTADCHFKGNFDGDGHTLTLKSFAIAQDDYALFRYVENSTIKNLNIDGLIHTQTERTAGLIAQTFGNCTIENCNVNSTIQAVDSGAKMNSGFVAVNNGELTINNSTFGGAMVGTTTTNWAGFVGENKNRNNSVYLNDCIFMPHRLNIGTEGSATFVRNADRKIHLNGCNFSDSLGDNNGVAQASTDSVKFYYAEVMSTGGIGYYSGLPKGLSVEIDDSNKFTVTRTHLKSEYKGGTIVNTEVKEDPITYIKSNAVYRIKADKKYKSVNLRAYLLPYGGEAGRFEKVSDTEYLFYPSSNEVAIEITKAVYDFGNLLDYDAANDTYKISTAAALQAFATAVNEGNDCAGLNFKLTDDIDLSGATWTPISNFAGTFDGDGHTISNGGTFCLKNTGTIENLKLQNIAGFSVSSERQGGFCVTNSGKITNCTLDGVTASNVLKAGGFVGLNSSTGTITNCMAHGITINGGDAIGGFCYYNSGEITDSFCQSTITGSDKSAFIYNGSAVTTGDGNSYYSNIAGYNDRKDIQIKLPAGITADYSGLYGIDQPIICGEYMYLKSGQTIKFKSENMSANSFLKIGDMYINYDAASDSYKHTFTQGGEFTAEFFDATNVINPATDDTIWTATDLQALAAYVNEGNDCNGRTFKLGANIDMANVANFTPIGNLQSKPFKGTFDGQGHTISNLTVNGERYNGLFGWLEEGTIKNLTIDNANISGYSPYRADCGGLVGFNKAGTIENCTVDAQVSGYYTGGICSNSYGKYSGNKYHSNAGDKTGATRLYKIDLPAGIELKGDVVEIGSERFAAEGKQITMTFPAESGLGTATLNGATLTGNKFTVGTSDISLTEGIINRWGKLDGTTGYEDKPYEIKTLDDLQALADYVSAGNDCAGVHFKLTGDISGVTSFHIGTDATHFKGIFDGNGHKITVNYNSNEKGCALFNYVEGATIENLTVDGTINTSAQWSGGYGVGAIAGDNGGAISNVKVINAQISGYNAVGGLVGVSRNNSSVRNCFIDGKVDGGAMIVGQRAEDEWYRFDDYFSGNKYYGNNSDNTGAGRCYKLTLPAGVTGTGKGIKVDDNFYYYNSGSTISLTLDTATASSETLVSITGLRAYNENLTLDDDGTYKFTMTGDLSVEYNGLPKIGNLTFSDGVYQINNLTDLQTLANYISDGGFTQDLAFKLTGNLSGVNFTLGTETNPFRGTLDGNGKTITLNLNDTTAQGTALFRYIKGATINNLTLSGSVNGTAYAAALAGFADGTNTISNVKITTAISSDSYVGGVIGHAKDSTLNLSNVNFNGNITADSAGGLIGWSDTGATLNFDNCISDGEYNSASYHPIALRDANANVTTTGYVIATTTGVNSVNGAGQSTLFRPLNLPEGITAEQKTGGSKEINGKTCYSDYSTFELTVSNDLNTAEQIRYLEFNGGKLRYDASTDKYFVVLNSNAPIKIVSYSKIDGLHLDDSKNYYLINTADDWNILATYTNGNDCAGLRFKLTADISVENQLGTSGTPFKGYFDGQGHTVTSNNALFDYAQGAIIRNVSGTAGIAANISGESIIRNCASYGDNLVGTNSGTLKIINSLHAPENNSGNFVGTGNATITNSYTTGAAQDGATKVYRATDLPAGLKFTTDNNFVKYFGKNYIAQGTTINFAMDGNAYYKLSSMKVNGEAVTDSAGVYSATLGETFPTIEFVGCPRIGNIEFDAETDTYKINSATDWNILANYINGGHDCASLTFKLTTDISTGTKQIGTAENPFAGTFDGGGYKITVSATPFNNVNGATIQNLIVAGTPEGKGFIGTGTATVKGSLFAPDNEFTGAAFGEGVTVSDSYYTTGTASGGAIKIYTLSDLPEQLKFTCADGGSINFDGKTYYKANASLTFEPADDSRRIIDGVTVGGIAFTKDDNANSYTGTLGGDDIDLSIAGTWHIQLNDNGDTYINNEDNISVLGGAGNDSIDNLGANVTIDTSNGNDTIKLHTGNRTVNLQGFGLNDVIEFDGEFSLGSEGYNNSDKKTVLISEHIWTTLEGVPFSDEGVVWSFDAENRTAHYANQVTEGVFVDSDGKIRYRNQGDVGNTLADLSGIGASSAIQTDNLDGYGGLQAGTKTIVLNSSHFAGGSGITVDNNDGGFAFALMYGTSGKQFTGSSKGEYIYVDEDDITITGGGGKDTISLGLNVTKITVTDMDKDDIIDFYGTIIKDEIRIDEDESGNKSLVVPWDTGYGYRYVTIGGISNPAENLNGWYDTDNGKAYKVGNANGFGADENGMYIGYVTANDLTPIIEFSGLSEDSKPYYETGYGFNQFNVAPENFAGDSIAIVQEKGGVIVNINYEDFEGKTLVGSEGNNTIYDINGELGTVYDDFNSKELNEIGDIIQNYGGSNLVIEGRGGNDSIISGGDSVTIDGGAGDDYIINQGNNVSINAGTGDNQVSIDSGREGVTVNAAQGNNTIRGNFDSLTVEGFNSGDVINYGYDYSITELELDDGKLVATYKDDYDNSGTFTIAGISQLASDVTETWSKGANGWTYSQSVGTEGAYIVDGNIGYAENKTFFTLSNLRDDVTEAELKAGVQVSGSKVIVAGSLFDTAKSPSIDTDNYAIQIAEMDLSREVKAGWNEIGEGNNTYAYYDAAGKTAGWCKDGNNWYYRDGVDSQVILGNVDTSEVIDDKWVPVIEVDKTNKLVTLDSSDFLYDQTNINVLSNAGGYTFVIPEDKSLNGMAKIEGLKFGSDAAGNAYYLINTVEDLQAFRDYVNNGNNCAGNTFKLTADIDLSGVENFTPIGNGENYFAGTFDGNDHIIRNLKIETSGNNEASLFASLGNSSNRVGTIQNVKLLNANIKGYGAGGLVSYNYGTIKDCFVDSTVSGSGSARAIIYSNSSANTVRNCYYHSNADDGFGTPVYNLGLPAGVTASYTGDAQHTYTVDNTTYYTEGATFNLEIDKNQVEHGDDYAQIAIKGGTPNEDGTYNYTIGDSAQVEFIYFPKIGNLEFDAKTDTYKIANANDLRDLREYAASHDTNGLKFAFTGDDYGFTNINTVEALQNFETYCKFGGTTAGRTFTLTDDIDLSGVTWTPIGNDEYNPFRGTFNGGGHTISKLNVTAASECVGLFGYLNYGGKVENLTLDNCTFESTFSADDHTYSIYVGSVVGCNCWQGTVSNCHVTNGTVKFEQTLYSNDDGYVTEYSSIFMGGVVGQNFGTINNSTFAGSVNDTGNEGDHFVGGIVGQTKGNIANCLMFGAATAPTDYVYAIGSDVYGRIDNCYRVGNATFSEYDDTPLAYELTLSEGITVAEDKGVTYNGKLYVPAGEITLRLGETAHDDNFEKITGIANATDNGNGTFTYTMPEKNSTPQFSGYPIINGFNFNDKGNFYEISSAEDLQTFAAYVNAGNTCAGLTFKQTHDINLSEIDNFTPINNFAGNFDGQDFIISDLKINSTADNVGLFAKVTGGTIQKVKLLNAEITGGNNVGGLVGYSENATIKDNFVDAVVTGTSSIEGGLVGIDDNGNYSGNGYHSDASDNTDATKYYAIHAPQNFTIENATSTTGEVLNLQNNLFAPASGTVSFKLTADDTRRVIDSLTYGESDTPANVDNGTYSLTLTEDTLFKAAYHIQLADGGDSYTNREVNISILGGNGSDTISNQGANVTIDGGTGDDEIKLLQGSGVVVDVSAGNDTIDVVSQSANNFSVGGFSAGDVIDFNNYSVNSVEDTQDGIRANLKDASTFDIKGLNLSDEETKWHLTDGKAALRHSIKAGAYLSDNKIFYQDDEFSPAKVELDGISDTDKLTFDEENIGIDGQAVAAAGISVVSNADNYNFSLSGDFSGKTFTATDSDDTISNNAANIRIDAGAGKDIIENYAAQNVTIVTGDGSDTIRLGDAVQSVNISDFTTGDKIQFLSNDVSAFAYEDTALNVTLANNNVVTLNGVPAPTITDAWLTVVGGAATFGKAAGFDYSAKDNVIAYETKQSELYFKIGGLKDGVTESELNDALTINGTTITITDESILDAAKVVTITSGYTLALEGVTLSENKSAAWTQDADDTTKYTYSTAGDTQGWRIVNNQIVHYDNTCKTFAIKDLPANLTSDDLQAGITVSGDTVSIYKNIFTTSGATVADNSGGFKFQLQGSIFRSADFGGKTFTGTDVADVIYNFQADNVSIDGGAGDDSISNNASNVSINGGAGDDTIENYSDGVKIDGGAGADLIKLHKGTGASITLGAGNDTISIDSAVKDFTVSDFTAGDEIQLETAIEELKIIDDKLIAGEVSISGIENIVTAENDWATTENGFVYQSWTTSGAKLDGNKIIYAAETDKTNLFELKGLKNDLTTAQVAAAIEVDDTTITIKDGTIFDTGKKITAPEGYNFRITDTNGHYAFDSGNGYTLANNTDDYSNLIRVYALTLPEGVNIASGIHATDGETTYAVGNVTFDGVKDGYVINSANITDNTTIAASLDTSKHYVFQSGTGYTLATADNISAYPDLTQVYEVTLPEGVEVTSGTYATADGKTYARGNITFSSATDIKGLERGDGGNYTFNIESDVAFELVTVTSLTLTDANASAMTLAADVGTVDGSARTKAIKIVGNALNNSIVGGSGNDTLNGGDGDDTLTGGEGSDLFIYSGGNDVITDYTAGDKISVTGEYNYELSDGDLILKFGDGNLTIKNAANTPITLNGASKKFTAEGVMTGTGTAITLNSDVTNYKADETVVTINAAQTNGATVIGNAKSNQFYSSDGADTFVYEHTDQPKITYKAGENGAIETITSTIYSAGSDVIYNYGTGDKISLAPDVELKDAYKQNDDMIVKVDSGTITVKDSADKEIKFVQGEEEITFSGEVFSKANTSILPATFTNDVTLDSETKNLDATKRTAATKLTSNNLANSITGGKGADTLDGGLGDDTLTGGEGSDTFIYSGGKDVIADYVAGEKISLTSDYTGYSISGDDITFNFADGGSLKLIDAANKSININGVAKNFEADKAFNSNNTAVTLGANTTTYTADETVVTIDGSAVTSGLEVVGNAKANSIKAGNNGSTLDGGAGNDTLIGGAGADKFVYGVGNDVIDNYGDSDKISLALRRDDYRFLQDKCRSVYQILRWFIDGEKCVDGYI